MDTRHGEAIPTGTTAAQAGAVSVRYWAGARAAAGVDGDTHDAPTTVADLSAALVVAHPDLASVLPVCSLLVDGLAADADTVVPAGAVVEVLPPFAGG